MVEKEYVLMAGNLAHFKFMKVIGVFKWDDYSNAVKAHKECKLPFKYILVTIYG